MIRQLPGQFALTVRGGLSPAVARLPMAWKDPLYKRAKRQGRAVFPAYTRVVVDVPAVLATAEPVDLVASAAAPGAAPAGPAGDGPLPWVRR